MQKIHDDELVTPYLERNNVFTIKYCTSIPTLLPALTLAGLVDMMIVWKVPDKGLYLLQIAFCIGRVTY